MDGSSLSVTTAMVGLLAVSERAVDVLWDLNTAPKDATALINQALHTVRECRSSIQVLYKTLLLLQSGALPLPERGTWIQLDELIATLTDMVLAFSRLHCLCDTLEMDAANSSPGDACARHGKRIRALSARIRFHNLSVAMMMTVLKCPGQGDAKRSRAELSHRITRLLTFNTSLAGRLRNLEDVLNAKAAAGISIYANPQRAEPGSSGLGSALSGPDVGQSTPDWSVFSGLNLLHIPILSGICLPLILTDLRDSVQFYAFAFAPQIMPDFHETVILPGMQHQQEQAASSSSSSSSASSSRSRLGLPGDNWDTAGMTSMMREVNNRAS